MRQRELKVSQDALKATNEDMMSLNEEPQSTNNKLETSKEERPSLNEERRGVNAQLQGTIDELQRANNDLDTLLTSTNIATVFLDRQLRIRRFTPAAGRLFTLIPSDVGRPLADIAQKFTDPALLADAATVLEALTPRRAEVAAPGGPWHVREILPCRTQDNRIDGVVITFCDMAADALHAARSEAEVALKALREKEAGLRAVVDTAVDAIITIDESGTVLSFNRAAERMFGYDAAEVIGKNVRLLMPPPDRKEHDGYLARYRETGMPRIIGIGREVEGLRKDGTRLPMDLAVSEVTNPTGRKFTGILRDLTERKQTEQRLREHDAQLAHLLRLKTAGELGASLAHQLNQPLTAIANDVHAGLAQLEAGKMARVRRLLAHTAAEAQRAAAIVRRFQDLLRKNPPRLERTDVRDVIRDAAELMRPEMARHQVAFQVQVPAEALSVRADRMQIEQVVLNLVQNALEAVQTGSGRRRVRVRAIRVEATRDARGLAQVTVADNGPGLAPVAADRLFEPFFSTKKGGLGMGLAIARTIVEAHQGRIWAERRPRRRGAAVSFSLPLCEEPEREGSDDGRAHRVRRRR